MTTPSSREARARALAEQAADWTTDWPGAVVTVHFTKEQLEAILLSAMEAERTAALEEIAKEGAEYASTWEDHGPQWRAVMELVRRVLALRAPKGDTGMSGIV